LLGRVNGLIHAVGILVSLPYIREPGEVITALSLGAGNTGRAYDLETDRRIAEFKMTEWRGGPETIRQNNLFADVFTLATAETGKRGVLYLLGTDHALRFLRGSRAMSSVLSRNPKTRRRFLELHGTERFPTAGSYWATVQHIVDLVDLRELVPAFRSGEVAAQSTGGRGASVKAWPPERLLRRRDARP
jgi:hypothetical protein